MNDSDQWRWKRASMFALVVIGAASYFSISSGGLPAEPPFADEAAVLAQTHYYRLIAEGRFSDPDWIDHAAFDHQPLYKYVIGFALHLTGQYAAVPTSLDDFKQWINGGVRAPVVDRRLITARSAMLIGSALAVGFVFAIARRLCGTTAGFAAAIVFMSSPLVFTHARRAMIDLPAVGLCVAVLWAVSRAAARDSSWKSTIGSWSIVAVAAALAPLAKWNASVGCFAGIAVGILLLLIGPNRLRLVGLMIGVSFVAAVVLFVALDPYYWVKPEPQQLSARLQSLDAPSAAEYRKLASETPWERGLHALEYRRQSMAAAKSMFPADYLSPVERVGAIALEGMGRWSLGNRLYSVPEAERPRSERRQPRDWINFAILAPLVVLGVIAAVRRGWAERRQSLFPVHWLLVAWIVLDWCLLLGNLTVDWDRYYLSVVAWSSVAATVGAHSLFQGFVSQLRLRPQELTPL